MRRLLMDFLRQFVAKRINRISFAFLVFVIILHYFSIGWMAQCRAIETIMNGRPGGFFTMALVMGFILLRTTAILLLPGFLLSWIVPDFIEFVRARKRENLTR